ncbi:hypothetical protein HDU87_003153 [Geranomyces variabilis]|uniref:START domain-containing protein n=1 Tax=Geranomyces variabilis TaxID=109894 RepID=A0AAD5TKK8_9FUNG|nr:hypothetical protein HDU87_003153 [Geranomyces variabilis]
MDPLTNAHPDLLLRAHDLYRTLSSAADWELSQPAGVSAGNDIKGLKVYRRAASFTCFKVVATVPDGPTPGVALKPRNFGAVLGEPSLEHIFDKVDIKERLDARTSLQQLTTASPGSAGGLQFLVINQTVATSTTFVSLSTSVPNVASAVSLIPESRAAWSTLSLLASVVERAADFDGLRVTILVKLDDKSGAEWMALQRIPRAITGAADQLRNRGFSPYLLNFAQAIAIRAEEYSPASATYALRWEVEGPEQEPDMGDFDHLGESTTSVFSNSSSSPIAMVEVRVDRVRWLNAKGGLKVTLRKNGQSHKSLGSLIEAVEDSEHGLRVSCLFEITRQPDVFEMSLRPCDQPGIWVNDTNVHLTDQPTLEAEIPEVRVSSEVSSPNCSARATVKTLGCATPGIYLPLHPHRFLKDESKAFNFFNLMLADAASFRHVSTQKKNVAVFHKEVLDHPIGALKGVAVYPVHTPLAARALLWDTVAVLQTAGVRKIWDSQTFDYETLLEHLAPRTFMVHAMNKAVWPTSARDATVVNTLIPYNKDRIQALVASIDAVDPALPPVKQGVVRAHVDVAGWDIEHDSVAGEVRVTHVIQFNPKGWIPSSIISAVSTQIPLAVDAVHAHLMRYGAPPYLVGCPEGYRVTKAEYSHGSGTYQLAAMPREEFLARSPGEQHELLLVRIDLEKWCSGDVKIDASQGVALGSDDAYGDSALVVGLVAEGSDIELRIAKGAIGSGLVVNEESCEVPDGPLPVITTEEETHDHLTNERGAMIVESHSAASLPISIPTPRAQSPSGSPGHTIQSEAWESPAARLSSSVGTRQPTSALQAHSLPLGGQTHASHQARFARQGSDSEQMRELRHAADFSLSKLLKVDGKEDDWTQVTALRSGLGIYKKNLSSTTTGNQFPIMKGVKVIEGFSAAEVFAVIKSFGCRRIWDDLLESGRRLEYGGEGVEVSYIAMPTFFPMTRRDLLVVNKDDLLGRYRTAGAGPQTIISASSSVSDSLLSEPALSSIAHEAAASVRAQLMLSGWILDPIDPYTSQHPIPSTKATFYFQADLGGSVPTAMYGFLVGSAPKHPARVEAYLKEHGVPPYIVWPGLPAADAGDSGAEFGMAATLPRAVRVSRQDFEHSKNRFCGEVLVPAHELMWMQARGPAKAETEAEVLPDEEADDGLLLLHVVVDLSRFTGGYDIVWESKRVLPSEAQIGGPDLRVEVVEVPPPPTHSSTHFPTAQDPGSAPGVGSGGSVDAALVTGLARKQLIAPVMPSSQPRATLKSGVTKHTVSLLLSRGALDASDDSDVACDDLGDLCACITIAPSKSAARQSGDASSGVSGRVTVKGAPVTVTGHQDSQHRALQRQRIRKRASRLSIGSTSRLSTGLAAVGTEAVSLDTVTTPPATQATTATLAAQNGFFGAMGLLGRRRPGGAGVAGADGIELKVRACFRKISRDPSLMASFSSHLNIQHAQRISSLPVAGIKQAGGTTLSQNPPQQSLFDNLRQRRTNSAAALLASDSFISGRLSTPKPPQAAASGTPPSQQQMETPPLLRANDLPLRQVATATPTMTTDRGGFWTRFRTPGKEGTFPVSLLLVCGFLAFCVGFALQLFLIDPWVYPVARPLATVVAPLSPSPAPLPPDAGQEIVAVPPPPEPLLPAATCPQLFCPPCPVCTTPQPPPPLEPATITVTVTITAVASAPSL